MTTDDFPGDLKGLHDALVNTKSVEQFLHDLAMLAARVVGSDLSCAMMMSSRPRPVTAACTDPVAAKMDAVQHELETGPCLDAMREDRMVRIDDTAAEPRWPEFSRRAAAQGIRSCLALPLSSEGQPIGALNLYARDAWAFGEAATERAAGFAENASGALALAIRLASHADLDRSASLIYGIAGRYRSGARDNHGQGALQPGPRLRHPALRVAAAQCETPRHCQRDRHQCQRRAPAAAACI